MRRMSLNPAYPALHYYGGKWNMASKIINHFPAHKTFVDVFAGGGSITFRKPRSHNEILNDINGEVVNLFKVLRDSNSILREKLELTPYAREEYEKCREPSDDSVEAARRTIVKSWLGIGDSVDNETGFRVSLSQGGGVTSAFVKYTDHMWTYARRLRGVVIENMDYEEILKRYDRRDTLFYLDPPYVANQRSKKHAYKFDWDDADHHRLFKAISTINGMFVLSGYNGPPYDQLPYRRVGFEAKTNFENNIEYLWLKP